MQEYHWVKYYNSVHDETCENLDSIIRYQSKRNELKGYFLSSLSKLITSFQRRNQFLNIHKQKSRSKIEYIRFDYDYASVVYQLSLFRSFMDEPEKITFSKINEKFFISEYKSNIILTDSLVFWEWLEKILSNTFSTLREKESEDNKLSKSAKNNIKKSRDFIRELSRYFSRDLNRYLSRDFSRYLSRYLSHDSNRYLSRDFNRSNIHNIIRDLNREFIRYFIRHFVRYFIREYSREFIRYFIRNMKIESIQYFLRDFFRDFIRYLTRYLSRDYTQDFINLISDLYSKNYKKKLNLEKITLKDEEMFFFMVLNELNSENIKFIDLFFEQLYYYLLFYKFNLSFFSSSDSLIQTLSGNNLPSIQQNYISILNPLLFPFTFDFLLTAALNHYSINLLADLNIKFHNKEITDSNLLLPEIEDYTYQNPFILYIINFSWDFYALEFNSQFKKESELNNLRLACFIINAAKVSLTAGVPCMGKNWYKIIKEADKSTDIFIRIALSLYRICCFEEKEKNSKLLRQQLKELKNQQPNYYKLIGIEEED